MTPRRKMSGLCRPPAIPSYRSYTEGNGPFLCADFMSSRSEKKQAEEARIARHDPERVARATHETHRHGRDARNAVFSIFGGSHITMPLNCDGSVYTDRMYEQDYELASAAAALLDRSWADSSQRSLSLALSRFLGRSVRVIMVWQYNNAATGYDTYLLFWDEVEA